MLVCRAITCSATIEIFARLQQYQRCKGNSDSSATIEIFARLQLLDILVNRHFSSATIEIFARLQQKII